MKTIATKRCRHCAAEMEAVSVVCPQCGRDVERSASVRSAVTIGLAVGSALVGGIIGTLLHLEVGPQVVLGILAVITIVTVVVVVRWIVGSRARAARRTRGQTGT